MSKHEKKGEENKQLEGVSVGGHGGKALIPGPNPGQIQKKINRQDEVRFYESINGKFTQQEKVFFPAYFGTVHVEGEGDYFIMEDLTHTFAKPCILDIKMGKTSVGEDAKPEKRQSMEDKDKSTTTVTLGQRITGYRTWKKNKNDFLKVGKDVTKKINDKNYLEHLREFFHNGEVFRVDIARHYLAVLEGVWQFMSTQSKIRMYSSSILFVFDALNNQAHGRLKLIDFAHVFDIKDGGHDDSYLFGLEKLLHFFREMCK
jgi:hypothetical protein